MAIYVIVIHDDEEAGAEKDRVLLVDALGVSGGDRCHELKRGERVDLWLEQGRNDQSARQGKSGTMT